MTSLNEHVARRVRERLAQRGLVPGDLAEALGVDEAAVSDLLDGRRIWTVDEVEEAAVRLGVEPKDLFPVT